MKPQKQTARPLTQKSRRGLKSLSTGYKIALALLAVLLVIILIADISDRLRFAGVEREMIKVSDTIMKPAGATENAPMTGQGNGLWEKNRCGTDVYCPYVHQGWVVAITPGQEAEFLESIVYKAGYGPKPEDVNHPCILVAGNDDMCTEKGNNDTFQMRATLYNANANLHRIPATDVTPKLWRYVSIWISPVSK